MEIQPISMFKFCVLFDALCGILVTLERRSLDSCRGCFGVVTGRPVDDITLSQEGGGGQGNCCNTCIIILHDGSRAFCEPVKPEKCQAGVRKTLGGISLVPWILRMVY